MNLKKKLLISMCVLLAVTFISGVTILAAGNYGTQTDPLVTLSYLTNIFKPKILSELGDDATKKAQDLTAELDAKINGFKAEIESSPGGGTQQQTDKPVTHKVVTLKKGQTASCSVGAEIMLRIGDATGTGTAPALVDSTSGSTLASGAALVANHMYVVTIEGNGVKAATDNVKVLIRGEYTVN